ncbi:MAG: hypothetical protein V9H26_03190 [Verrucomicrobiota bacterium]
MDTNITNAPVIIFWPDRNEKPLDWPHHQVPRVGEKFCTGRGGPFFEVEHVSWQTTDGEQFVAVVFLKVTDGGYARQ